MLFLLWPCLFFLSGAIFPLFCNSILGTYWPGEFIFQCHIFLPFHAVHEVLKAGILKWFAIPFSREPCFVRLSTMTHLSWVALHNMAHSFIVLDNAAVHVISLVSHSDCGFHSLCSLMDKDKRLMEASWWNRLTEEYAGSCSDGWGPAL